MPILPYCSAAVETALEIKLLFTHVYRTDCDNADAARVTVRELIPYKQNKNVQCDKTIANSVTIIDRRS